MIGAVKPINKPGYAQFSWGSYELETPLFFGAKLCFLFITVRYTY